MACVQEFCSIICMIVPCWFYWELITAEHMSCSCGLKQTEESHKQAPGVIEGLSGTVHTRCRCHFLCGFECHCCSPGLVLSRIGVLAYSSPSKFTSRGTALESLFTKMRDVLFGHLEMCVSYVAAGWSGRAITQIRNFCHLCHLS